MAVLLALMIGLMVAGGVWLVLRPRSWSVVMGLTLIGYATNLFILSAGRIDRVVPPLAGRGALADPIPQALVLTAIVIGLGMTAFLIALALRGVGQNRSDRIGEGPVDDDPVDGPDDGEDAAG